MKSLKSAARRGVIVSVTAASALALASCSAGHVTQTADQVAAVDGSEASTEDGLIAVRDVTILVEPDNQHASLKFTAVNQGYEDQAAELESVTVDGQEVQLQPASLKPINRDQRLVGDSKENLDNMPQAESEDIQYVATTMQDDDFGYAGHRTVVFQFSNGDIEVNATIAASQKEAGEYNRDVESTEGYTTEEPSGH